MSIEAMKQALEALDISSSCVDPYYVPLGKSMIPEVENATSALRKAIEQAEKEQADFQDFVAKVQEVEKQACEIINRQWIGLTMEDVNELYENYDPSQWYDFLRDVEAKLKEKNHVD